MHSDGFFFQAFVYLAAAVVSPRPATAPAAPGSQDAVTG